MMCLGEGATGIVYFSLNSGSYFPNSAEFEPSFEGESPTAWDLRDQPELVRAVKRVNRRVRYILNRFSGPASREWVGEKTIRYRWDNGTDSLTVEVTVGPELGVRYDF